MNNYPVWWDKSITVFNKFEHPTTHIIRWYKTILTDCFWKYTENQLTIGETVLETAVTLCRVPKSPMFRERYEWEQDLLATYLTTLDNEQFCTALGEPVVTADGIPEYCDFFTFGTGDIVIRGAVSDVVNEYVAGQRSSDLLTKYRRLQGCMVVQRCAVNTGEGRGNEHYLVKGV